MSLLLSGNYCVVVFSLTGGNGGQNFFNKHTGGDLWQLKISECTMANR